MYCTKSEWSNSSKACAERQTLWKDLLQQDLYWTLVFQSTTYPISLKQTVRIVPRPLMKTKSNCYFPPFTDCFNDKHPCTGLQWGVLWQREAVQTWALAAREQHHQPLCSYALWHRKEDVHRPAAGRAAAAAGHVLGKRIRRVHLSSFHLIHSVIWDLIKDFWPDWYTCACPSCSWSENTRL